MRGRAAAAASARVMQCHLSFTGDETKRFRSMDDVSELLRMEQLSFIRGPEEHGRRGRPRRSAEEAPYPVQREAVPGVDAREQVVTAVAHVGVRRGGGDLVGSLDVDPRVLGAGDP